MSRLTALSAVCVAVMVLAMPTPTAAATVSFEDKSGDAPARFDITRVTFVNSAKVISVKSRFRDLRASGTQIFGTSLTVKGIDGSYAASTVRRAKGAITAELWRYDGDGAAQVDCDVRARWRLGRDVIRLRFPQSCLADQGRVTASAYVGAGDGSAGDPADWTRTVPVPFD